MQVNVRYFAVVRERLGRETDSLEVPSTADVGAARDALEAMHPQLAPLRRHLRVAVNQSMVGDDHRLADGDELAIIPPVAGGTGDVERLARVVSDRPPSLDAVVEAVRGPANGGVVAFIGLVRAHSQGRE